jgi:hypothetical protein
VAYITADHQEHLKNVYGQVWKEESVKKAVIKLLDKSKSQRLPTNLVYKLGKVRNKYIIIDIVGLSGYREDASRVMWGTARSFRGMIIQNHRAYLKLIIKKEAITVTHLT